MKKYNYISAVIMLITATALAENTEVTQETILAVEKESPDTKINTEFNDPTTPIESLLIDLKLQAIAINESMQYCVVNDRIYQENDRVNGSLTIVKIQHNSIILERNQGEIHEIQLN